MSLEVYRPKVVRLSQDWDLLPSEENLGGLWTLETWAGIWIMAKFWSGIDCSMWVTCVLFISLPVELQCLMRHSSYFICDVLLQWSFDYIILCFYEDGYDYIMKTWHEDVQIRFFIFWMERYKFFNIFLYVCVYAYFNSFSQKPKMLIAVLLSIFSLLYLLTDFRCKYILIIQIQISVTHHWSVELNSG